MPANPTQSQIEAISALIGTEAGGPLVMLNLNRYRERAKYDGPPPGGESPDVSGHEAYGRYSEKALARLAEIGGEVLWYTQATMTVIGDDSDVYDEVIAVRYPSAQAFIDLALDPEIGVALAHRTAGLERAALIRCDEGMFNPLTKD
ncbi:MAG: DUF1330 domain-containing protein [Thermoleophilaceae bacterium]|nr:DUF1330 domain-containing protein [Thermoleophilaceae bacterium]